MLKSLLSRVTGVIEPRPIGVSLISGADGERLMIELEDRPRVALVTDKAVRQWDPEAPSLKELGYGMYDREMTMMASYYARKPWLWLLKAWTRAGRAFWHVVSCAHGRLWYSSPGSEGRRLRWGDVRPGPGPFFRLSLSCRDAWLRVPHWVYCLRYLLPVNYKTAHAPPHGVYVQLEAGDADGQWKWKRFHPVRWGPLKRLHVDFSDWLWGIR